MPIVNIVIILLLLPFCIIPALYNKHLDKKQEKEWKEHLNRQQEETSMDEIISGVAQQLSDGQLTLDTALKMAYNRVCAEGLTTSEIEVESKLLQAYNNIQGRNIL